MTDIEDQIRVVLRAQADAMHVPDARPGEQVARVFGMPPDRRRARLWMAAAAAVLVIVAGIAIAQRRAEAPEAATTPAQSTAAAAATSLRFETPTVRLDASSVEVVVGDQTFAPTTDVRVDGDPGTPNEYTTLELTWHEGVIEQRINMYFKSDGIDWWVDEIRTYNGQSDGDWFEPTAHGQYFKSALGAAYRGDLDLPNLHIRDMTLEAFRRPTASDDEGNVVGTVEVASSASNYASRNSSTSASSTAKSHGHPPERTTTTLRSSS
ncbi:MAG TPA: hypothetical protein VFV63_02855 [Ilumatobacteraceae bacterium]|nr:hypothetical protein [Ilumatobacteraceae bacterium]